jgi:oxygen-dependent protoporphyrinogen oxidase
VTEHERPKVLVLGAGIAGLAAAFQLSGGEHPDHAIEITVIEQSPRCGGKIASAEIAGRTIDLAADGFLARRPEALELVAALGRTDALRSPGASGASIFARGKVRAMPERLSLGIPTQWRALAKSRVLTLRGLVRAGLDVVAPRHDLRGKLGDRAIGPLVAAKLGREVVQTLVDPMLGGIHAGHVSEMSASATFPQLLEVAGNSGSLMHALRATLPPSPTDDAPVKPVFNSLDGGVASLISTLVETLTARGVTFATETEALGLRKDGDLFRLSTSKGEYVAQGVVVALPAEPAARVLRDLDEELAALLNTITYASAGVVTLVIDPDLLPKDRHGTGLLVPSTSRRRAGTAFFTTAVTYLSTKWPHVARASDELIRVSVGKIDDVRFASLSDDQLIRQVLDELSELFGVVVTAREAHVTRWMNALPQYQVNHLLRVAGIEAAAERLGDVVLTGAAIGGVGIPACIGHGRKSGQRIRRSLLG